MIKKGPSDYDVLKTYTSELDYGSKKLYKYVNEQIVDDRASRLKHLMPFIRRATYRINHEGPDESCVVYRGMELDEDQLDFFTPGKVFRFPVFTSTSISKSIARRFGDILFKIHIFSNCPQVRNVAEISCFPLEEEWLFVPYSLFKVTKSEGREITLKAIDNSEDVSESTTSDDDSSDTD
jgi:hypothetical protein